MHPAVKLVLLALLTACSVGEVPIGGGGGGVDGGVGRDSGGGSGDPNQLSFTNTITPLVGACLGCHSAVQPPVLTSYAALDAAYKAKPGTANILVTKGNGTGGVHQGVPYFDTNQQNTVAAWIDGLQ